MKELALTLLERGAKEERIQSLDFKNIRSNSVDKVVDLFQVVVRTYRTLVPNRNYLLKSLSLLLGVSNGDRDIALQ